MTNKINLRSVEEFQADYVPIYNPIMGVFISPNTNAIMSSVTSQYYGIASSMQSTMRQIGQMFSMGVSMIMLSIFVGKVSITPEYYPDFVNSTRITFAIFAVLCFGGIFASLARGKLRKGEEEKIQNSKLLNQYVIIKSAYTQEKKCCLPFSR